MIYVFDIEIYPNYSCFVFKDVKSQMFTHYEIGAHENDFYLLWQFLHSKPKLIGYNNIGYDNFLIQHISDYPEMIAKRIDSTDATRSLYDISTQLIHSDENQYYRGEFKTLDLYRIWHYNNPNRRMSLKAVEAAIGFHNVQDLPYDPTKDVTVDQAAELLQYCYNDVQATYEFYLLSINKIKFRLQLSKKYRFDPMNLPDSSIGEKIFLYELADRLGATHYEIQDKAKGYDGERFSFDEIILPYVSFRTPELRRILESFRDSTYVEGYKFEEKCTLKDLTFNFGLGGLHATKEKDNKTVSEVYKSTKDHRIVLVDVSSYYPNLSIQNKIYPRHLGPVFCEVYEDLYNRRAHAKYTGDDDTSETLKLALNAVYGKSKSKHSFLYDPKMTMSITINGQLLLAMLCEKFLMYGIKIIQANTDGITVYVHKDDLPDLELMTQQWAIMTNLKLDFDWFDIFVQKDVNNYIALYSKDKHPSKFDKGKDGIKYKGLFEIDKDYHKNPSARVVSIALKNYFINNISVLDTIQNHTDVKDFAIIQRSAKDTVFSTITVDKGKITKEIYDAKVLRFIFSHQKKHLEKVSSSGASTRIGYPYGIRIMNKLLDHVPIDLDYRFYVKEAVKIIDVFSESLNPTLF